MPSPTQLSLTLILILTLTPTKAASLSGGEKVDFRAHKELAKSRGANKSSPEQQPARSFRGQPKPLARLGLGLGLGLD